MGVLARSLARDEERGLGRDFLADDDNETVWESGVTTTAGASVSRKSALGLSTVWRCVDLLTGAVSGAPKDIVVKIGSQSFAQYQKPSWLASPAPDDPSLTIEDHFSMVAMSLLLDGNFFVRVSPYVLDPQALLVIDPRNVVIRKGPVYDIYNDQGQKTDTIGPMEMLHGTWLRPPGSLRGISPLEALREGFGGAIATQGFANRFFGQGASLAFGVEVPGALDQAQKDELREGLKKRHAGPNNSHAIGILTGGAKFVTGLAPTPEQAQFIATRQLQREELCAIYGVPPQLVNAQERGASSYASAFVHEDEYRKYAVLPLCERIEPHYNRLVSVPEGINAANASAQFKFNLDHLARVDMLTRFQAYAQGTQGGFLMPDEARGYEDLPPLPGGVGAVAYAQQQMQPLGSPPARPALPSGQEAA